MLPTDFSQPRICLGRQELGQQITALVVKLIGCRSNVATAAGRTLSVILPYPTRQMVVPFLKVGRFFKVGIEVPKQSALA
jgi:hypothetical protein